ncbi:MAG: hypothetical protein CL908_26185 [Deltaproteobacteria bacterium]|nr:hypothetical protein [Deltaproteobacteria bacterium]
MSPDSTRIDRRAFFRSLLRPKDAARPVTRFERVAKDRGLEDGVLWGTAARGPDDIYAVGDDGLVMHYDGVTWGREGCDTTLPLHAIACTGPETAVAVGWLGAIVEGTKREWHLVQGGQRIGAPREEPTGRLDHPLFGVYSDGNGRSWAVGDGGRIVEGREGKWRERDSGCSANLRSIVGMPDGSLLACGADGTILRGSADHWERMDSQTSCVLTGLAVLDRGDIIAVGGEFVPERTGFEGRLLHFDGGAWRVVDTSEALPRFRNVSAVDGEFVIVGDAGLALRFDGSDLVRLDSGTGHDLYSATALGDGRSVLCGGFGTLVQSVEADARASRDTDPEGSRAREVSVRRWRVVDQEQSRSTLRGIWSAPDERLFAVGDDGTVLQFDGDIWFRMESPTDVRLHNIWGRATDDVYAVGENGVVLHFDGSKWQVAYQGSLSLTLVAVTGFDDGSVFCVGDGGLILRFDGFAWERVESGTSVAFFDVWGLDSLHVLAVGEAGTVLRFNGERWDAFTVGVEHALYSVWGSALDDVYVSGSSGSLLRFDGRKWNREATPVRSDLFSIAGSGGSDVVAVGSLGTVLRRDQFEWFLDEVDCEDSLRSVCVASNGHAFAAGDAGRIMRTID